VAPEFRQITTQQMLKAPVDMFLRVRPVYYREDQASAFIKPIFNESHSMCRTGITADERRKRGHGGDKNGFVGVACHFGSRRLHVVRLPAVGLDGK